MARKSGPNIALLEKVIAHIKAEPKRLEMGTWVEKSDAAPCGTAACIAGWACLLSLPKPKIAKVLRAKDDEEQASILRDLFGSNELEEAGQDELNLTNEQREALFYSGSWPTKFADRYYNASTARIRASAAVARIRHFIKTGE